MTRLAVIVAVTFTLGAGAANASAEPSPAASCVATITSFEAHLAPGFVAPKSQAWHPWVRSPPISRRRNSAPSTPAAQPSTRNASGDGFAPVPDAAFDRQVRHTSEPRACDHRPRSERQQRAWGANIWSRR